MAGVSAGQSPFPRSRGSATSSAWFRFVARPSSGVETRWVDVPETRYARSGDVAVALQARALARRRRRAAMVSHVGLNWDVAGLAAIQRGLAEHARVIVFDKRGTGLSDRRGAAAPRVGSWGAVMAARSSAGLAWVPVALLAS